MKYYDKKNRRIIMFGEKASPNYWDKHWEVRDFTEKVKAGKTNRLVKKFTTIFLNPGARILEGGCGIGQNVYELTRLGYDAYGVDFAKKTVGRIKEAFPEIKISVQDVRKLDFSDNYFDGYWSLGVIEHFWEGYDEILKEAKRIIRPGGYLFLTFPYISPLRKLKSKLGIYKIFNDKLKPDNFYQFILDTQEVKRNVEKFGFKLCEKYSFNATKGIKDEVFLLKPILQKIYDSQAIFSKGINFLISLIFSKIAGHTMLLIFKT